MSFINRLKEVFVSDEVSGPTNICHVVDTSGLAGGRGDRLSPRDRLALLQKLASFAEREQLQMVVLLDGRPLREAADGGEFKSVTVYYAEGAEGLAKRALEIVRGKGRRALLVTQQRDLEEQAQQAGVGTLRASSLRRALDENGGGGGGRGGRGGSEGGRSGGRGRRRSRPRRPANSDQGQGRSEKPASAKAAENKPQAKPSKDGVSDLIDLV